MVDLLLLGPHSVHAICELFRLREIRQFGFHPYHIAERGVCDRAVDGALATSLIPVVSLSCPRCVPVEVDVHTGQARCDCSRFGVALALAFCQEIVDEFLLVHVHAGVDGVDDGFVEELEVGFFGPRVFDGLELIAILAGLLGGVHKFTEGLESGVRAALDVVVVAWVDGGGDKSGGFGIGSGNGEEIGAHDVCLSADGY